MSQLFTASNTRLEKLKQLKYLDPITFKNKGNITGIKYLESTGIKAGPVTLSWAGDIRGVKSLYASGDIKTNSSLRMKEFNSEGKISSAGPIITEPNGYVSYVGVSPNDTSYGASDPYLTRKYSCTVPDTLQNLLLWSVTPGETHFTIYQGVRVYTYVFPAGLHTPSTLCSLFNKELQVENSSPLQLAYDNVTDSFNIYVDDTLGAQLEPDDMYPNPTYKLEFLVCKESLLLVKLGFVTQTQAQSGAVTDRLSSNRSLASSYPTTFQYNRGFSQGYYTGGVKTDTLKGFWSPATHVWVGEDDSQTCRYKVLKTLNDTRSTASLGHEQLLVETLKSDSLVSVEGTITAPLFTFDTTSPYTFSQSTPTRRGSYLPIVNVSNEGTLTLHFTDSSPSYTELSQLQAPSTQQSTLHLRSRNPKTKDVGPVLAFEGSSTNTQESSTATTTYSAIKGVPNSVTTADAQDDRKGGQLVIMTAPLDSSVPVEALRVNEAQQVLVGTSYTESSDKLYVKGDTTVEGQLSASTLNISHVTYTPTLTAGANVVSSDDPSGWYLSFGTLKVVFVNAVLTSSVADRNSGTCNVSLPSGVLSSVLSCQISCKASSANTVATYSNTSTSFVNFEVYFASASTSNSATVSLLVLGSA